MIKLWFSQKLRLLSLFCFFVLGASFILLPWFVSILAFAAALVIDFFSFKLANESDV